MKNYTAEERKQNILQRAAQLGFVSSNNEFDESVNNAIEFLLKNDTDTLHENCELTVYGNFEHLVWSDGMGYTHKESRRLESDDWWRDNNLTEFFITWLVNSEGRFVELYQKRTFDVMFNLNDGELIADKGFQESYNYCMSYIRRHKGTNDLLFHKYKGGIVYIYCYETEENVYWEKIE